MALVHSWSWRESFHGRNVCFLMLEGWSDLFHLCNFRLLLPSGTDALDKILCSKKTIKLKCLGLNFLHSHYLYFCSFFLCFRVELGYQLLSMCVVLMLALSWVFSHYLLVLKAKLQAYFRFSFVCYMFFVRIVFANKWFFC